MECGIYIARQRRHCFLKQVRLQNICRVCGEMKYTKKRCGDGPHGNSFYTQSNNIESGGSIRASSIQEYRYAACEWDRLGKSEIKDSPDGSFKCIASDQAANKIAWRTAKPCLRQNRRHSSGGQPSPIGTWQVTTDAGEKAKLTINATALQSTLNSTQRAGANRATGPQSYVC